VVIIVYGEVFGQRFLVVILDTNSNYRGAPSVFACKSSVSSGGSDRKGSVLFDARCVEIADVNCTDSRLPNDNVAFHIRRGRGVMTA